MPTNSTDILSSLNNNSISSLSDNAITGTILNTSNFSLASNRTLSSAQQLNELALRLANNQLRQQNRSNNSNNVNGNTFTMFVTSDDIIENQKANVTSEIPKITKHQPSSIVTNNSCSYDLLDANDNVIATWTYARKYNSISEASNSGSTALDAYKNYMEYKSLLLSSGEDEFRIKYNNAPTNMTSFVAISYKREYYKDKLDPGNVKIALDDTVYIDNSNGSTEDPTINQSYFSYDIIKSGSTDNTTYGIIYPSYGLILLDNKSTNIVSETTDGNNALLIKFLSTIKNIAIEARATEAVTSTYYFIRLKNGMYNYSNNPTFVTGSLGDIKIPLFKESPTSYITTVGLYNNRQELLAVARLSKPIPKSFTNEVVLQVKLDF